MQQFAQLIPVRTTSMPQVATRLWLLMAADITGVIWTATLGTWFDETSRLTSIITLGGHHVLVMILSGLAFALLGALALSTNGFRGFRPAESALVGIAIIVSMVALAGFVSLVAGIVLLGFFLGILARLIA